MLSLGNQIENESFLNSISKALRLSVRLLFLTSPLHKEFGGPPQAVVGAAISLADRGHEVIIYVCGQSAKSISNNSNFFELLKIHNVEIFFTRSRRNSKYGGFGSLSDLKKLNELIKASDLVSSHGVYNFQNFSLGIITLRLKKYFTIMPHGTLTNYQRSKHKFRKHFFGFFFYKLLLKRVSNIIVATASEYNELPENLRAKAVVVGLGQNRQASNYDKNREYAQESTFLLLGRIAHVKRPDLAIEGFAKFLQLDRKSHRLLICGTGEKRLMNDIQKLAKDLNISHMVDFLGWVDADEKSEILKKSDWLLMTSENENFAMSVAEALVNGMPCVVSRNVALSALVEKHSAGVIFENLNSTSIAKALFKAVNGNQGEFRNAAILAGKSLSWDHVILKWEKVFYDLSLCE